MVSSEVISSGQPASSASLVPWILRVGVAGCFIGHGAFGIITKSGWLPYFAVGGIDESLAWRLMPWIGAMDITMGVLALAWPCRALFYWAAAWAAWTALLRPLSGEPFWEALERAGNYGVPIALLTIAGMHGVLFARLRMNQPDLVLARHRPLAWALRLTTATLLAGHAGLGLFSHKAGLANHYAALGISDSASIVPMVGLAEFALAALVLIMPRPAVLMVICLWKLASESLFIVAGAPAWEFVERFGSYTAPLALAFLLSQSDRPRRSHLSPAPA